MQTRSYLHLRWHQQQEHTWKSWPGSPAPPPSAAPTQLTEHKLPSSSISHASILYFSLQIGAHGEQNVPPRDRDGHHGRCELGLIVDDKRLAMLEPPRPAMQMCPLPSYPTLPFPCQQTCKFLKFVPLYRSSWRESQEEEEKR